MLTTGLVSVTFRTLAPEEIIAAVTRAGLGGIEWGGDVHVPHGDTARAAEVGRSTREAGLEVISYGSYYRAGESEDWDAVLETAIALEASTIRVWAGHQGSEEFGVDERRHIIDELKRISESAAASGIAIGVEYHRDTLTDTDASARRMYEEVDHPNFLAYWQPQVFRDHDTHLVELRGMLRWLKHVHVFQVEPETRKRRSLASGRDAWIEFVSMVAAEAGDRDHAFLIEFVEDDRLDAFYADAEILKEIVEYGGHGRRGGGSA